MTRQECRATCTTSSTDRQGGRGEKRQGDAKVARCGRGDGCSHEDFPGVSTGVEQAGDELGLERVELDANINGVHATISVREAGSCELGVRHGCTRVLPLVQSSWARDVTVKEGGDGRELGGLRADELGVVVEDAGHALLGNVQTANVGQAERCPTTHGGLHGGQALRVHGGGCCSLVTRASEEDAKMADELARAHEPHAGSRVNAICRGDGGVRAQQEALGLEHIQATTTSRAEELDTLDGSRKVGEVLQVEGRVVGVLMGRRGGRSVRQEDGTKDPGRLQVVQVGREGLRLDVVQQRRERTPLGHAGGNREQPRAVAIVEDLRPGACEEHLDPTLHARTEAKVLEATAKPASVRAIVSLLEVKEHHAALTRGSSVGALQPVHLLQVVKDVVADVTAGDEGRLGGREDVVDGAAQARSKDPRSELVVTVQQGDGPVAVTLGARFAAPLVDAGDEAQALRGGERCSAVDVLEGLLEGGKQQRGDGGGKRSIELVRQAI
jgi:hypothetical protein